jgi:isopenicillin N synthase-like dioxygenase
MVDIPVIDFSAYSASHSSDDKARIAARIDEAFRNVGFVYLTHHGVPQSRVDECFQWVSLDYLYHLLP